ncbi:MAG: iron-siderophore ABC transporter substrate-binding protein [Pseudomonadota bacterium]
MRAFLAVGLASASLLAAPAFAEPVEIEDGRGMQTIDAAPERVVVLNWALTEQLLSLGVEPVGAADIDGYNTWVVRPPIPDGVSDTGLRHAPNFEQIASLSPDLILLGDLQRDFTPLLERVAPVLQFRLFDEAHDNAAVSRSTFLDLARLFGKDAEADAALSALDERLAAKAEALAEVYGGNPPKVAVVRFADATNLQVYGANSMAEAALHALGLENAWPQRPSRWGLTTRPILGLGELEDGYVLYIEPLEEADALFASPVWQAMPVVLAGRVHAIPPTWTYGGALSVGVLADEIAKVLLAAAPK